MAVFSSQNPKIKGDRAGFGPHMRIKRESRGSVGSEDAREGRKGEGHGKRDKEGQERNLIN